jgi:hypothetical protein
MSAASVVMEARSAGIQLGVDGDDLVLEAPAPPAAAVLDALSRHKVEIVTLLRPGRDGWSAEDWQVLFDERAGIVEFDGGQLRPQAEVQAFACCIVDWLNRNPERSPAERGLECGDREHAHDPPLLYGVEPTGHARLHSRCPAGYEAREAKAVLALTALGISAPVVHPMKRDEQSKHLPSDASRESRTAKNQFAFQRQINGG